MTQDVTQQFAELTARYRNVLTKCAELLAPDAPQEERDALRTAIDEYLADANEE